MDDAEKVKDLEKFMHEALDAAVKVRKLVHAARRHLPTGSEGDAALREADAVLAGLLPGAEPR